MKENCKNVYCQLEIADNNKVIIIVAIDVIFILLCITLFGVYEFMLYFKMSKITLIKYYVSLKLAQTF